MEVFFGIEDFLDFSEAVGEGVVFHAKEDGHFGVAETKEGETAAIEVGSVEVGVFCGEVFQKTVEMDVDSGAKCDKTGIVER